MSCRPSVSFPLSMLDPVKWVSPSPLPEWNVPRSFLSRLLSAPSPCPLHGSRQQHQSCHGGLRIDCDSGPPPEPATWPETSSAFSGPRSAGVGQGCSGCCAPRAPSRGGWNHHCPRWRSHYRSDFAYFSTWVGAGCSPRRAARLAGAQQRCRGRAGSGAWAASCRPEVMAARRSCVGPGTRSAARGVRSGRRASTGYTGSLAIGSSAGARCR